MDVRRNGIAVAIRERGDLTFPQSLGSSAGGFGEAIHCFVDDGVWKKLEKQKKKRSPNPI